MLKKLSENRYQVDAEVSWAKVLKPETKLKYKSEDEYETKYSIVAKMNKEDTVAMMLLRTEKSIGQDFKKDKKTGDTVFQFYRTTDVNVETNEPIQKLLVVGNDDKLIGNGSKATISFHLKPYHNDNSKHRVVLEGVKITELVVFTGGSQIDDDPIPETLFNENNPNAAF